MEGKGAKNERKKQKTPKTKNQKHTFTSTGQERGFEGSLEGFELRLCQGIGGRHNGLHLTAVRAHELSVLICNLRRVSEAAVLSKHSENRVALNRRLGGVHLTLQGLELKRGLAGLLAQAPLIRVPRPLTLEPLLFVCRALADGRPGLCQVGLEPRDQDPK